MTMTAAPFDSILDALQVEILAPEEQEELLIDLNDLIIRSSLIRMVEQMDDETRDEFSALTERDVSEDEMAEFLAKRVPNADALVSAAVQDLANDILAVTST